MLSGCRKHAISRSHAAFCAKHLENWCTGETEPSLCCYTESVPLTLSVPPLTQLSARAGVCPKHVKYNKQYIHMFYMDYYVLRRKT